MSGNKVLDSHQHFWRPARGDYGWLSPESGALYRDYLPGDLAPLLEARGIAGTILVQAAPSIAETYFLLDVADATPWVEGVVGWVDLSGPTAVADLERLARNPLLRGVRPMIQDIADPEWMLGAALTPAYEALVELGLTFDALVRPVHLPNLLRLLHRFPGLRATIDHGAKPDIAGGAWQPWADLIGALARETRVTCKLSGLVTEAAPDWTEASIRPYADHLLEAFGARRLMWGSDWPVVDLARGYGPWWSFTQGWLARLDAADAGHILGGTARAFYRITPRDGDTSS